MIVPFVYDLDVTTGSDMNSIAMFYFYLEMVLKQNSIMIVHEKYLVNTDEYVNDSGFISYLKSMEIKIPTNEDVKKLNKYLINLDFEKTLLSKYHTRVECWVDIWLHENESIDNFMRSAIINIERQYHEKIDAFVGFNFPKSFLMVAKEFGIPVIYNERTSFRPPMFVSTGYFDFNELYSKSELQARYSRFMSDKNQIDYLTRKEILAFFMTNNGLNLLNLFDRTLPIYELGVVRPELTCMALKDGLFTSGEVVLDANNFYSKSQIKYRERTDSETVLEFILSCKRIASVHSNMSFDAMLLGRTSCSYGQSPFAFMANNGIKDTKENIAPIDFINFVVFGYFVPWQLIRNVDYIKWRLSKPSEIEIYNKHLEFYLEQRGLTREVFNQKNEERLEYILRNQNIKPLDLRNRKFKLENNNFLINGSDENNVRKLFKDGISFGPYWSIPNGNYSLNIIGENLSSAEFYVYYCKGQKHVDFAKTFGTNLIELQFKVEEKISDIEFVIKNESENIISIFSIELSGGEE